MLLYGPEPSVEPVRDRVQIDLPPGPAAVSAAREQLARTLQEWRWERCADAATLCVSEVTTALLTMDCDLVQLVLLRCDEHVTVELRCSGARHRFSTVIGDDATVARGMALIDELVPLWGVRPADDGEAVWFELR
jgi:hypothetical protein